MLSGFRARLRETEPLLGTFLKIPSTQPAEILGQLGFDFAVIDEEHAPLNPETTDAIVLACRAHGMAGLVRVRTASEILRVLDCGADGVLVPHVTDARVAREAVARARYAAARGFSPSTRAGAFGTLGMAQHLAQQDARCAVIAMIEDAEAISTIEEIVAVEGLDAIFIGRADLAVSMGGNLRGSDLEAAVNRVLAAAVAVGLPVMILAANSVELAHLRARGATSFLTGSDQGFLLASAAQARASFLPRPGS
ncbi:HpcH/HpaI aldolase family protein [Sinirhodobacter huangdaonensis]|uniref:Aldolase n=1 Tax=Paenirhodobacter huangdaonensis TaxID=2501515 RepID=A0A3S3MPH2_9RHOB|nr:aldolase/citrate lyase family protein [Sinirhodobacter huangdaonensis]RWR51199.1 aldolase [Sinirhodobacter huangdaonensis]